MSILNEVRNLAIKHIESVFSITDLKGDTHDLCAKDLGYAFQFDKSKRRFGACNYTRRLIKLSRHMCERNPDQLDKKINDTILHELAHAFCREIYGSGVKGHGIEWQHIAKQIGCNGKARYDFNDFGGINKPMSKYTLVCDSCGNETPAHRKLKRSYSCGSCGNGVYDASLKLRVIQNY